jgi:hypothetical protein
MCNGEGIMKNRQLVHINEEKLLKNIRKHSIEIVTRANIFWGFYPNLDIITNFYGSGFDYFHKTRLILAFTGCISTTYPPSASPLSLDVGFYNELICDKSFDL